MADPPAPPSDEAPPPLDFPAILQQELEQIDQRRQRRELDDPPPEATADADAQQQASEKHLVGLALSGGGIRSATFNLGLLQGLADQGLLKLVDYLSTVSGGGYIGGWLAAWIRRGGGLAPVEQQLRTCQPRDPDDLDPVAHLRRYSNYLAPRQGFLSADNWVLWATYFRNFLLNQCVLLPAVVAVLVLVRLAMLLYYPWTEDLPTEPTTPMTVVAAALAVLWVFAFASILWGSREVLQPGQSGPGQPDRRTTPGRLLLLVLAALLFAVLFCSFAPYELLLKSLFGWSFWHVWLLLFALPSAALVALCYLIALPSRHRRSGGLARALLTAAVGCLAGFLAGSLLFAVYRLLHPLYAWDGVLPRDYVRVRATARVMTLGPPLVLGVMVLAASIGIGLQKRLLREEVREWWSSVCGRLLVAAGLWLAVALVALYGTALVLWAGPYVGTALGSGWLVTVVVGILAGGGPGTGGHRPRNGAREWLARLSPAIFVAGLLVAVSLLLHFLIDNPPRWKDADDAVWRRHIEPERPATRVVTTDTRTGDGSVVPMRRDVTERRESIHDPEIVQQTYWLGILNTTPDFVPRVRCYQLEDNDFDELGKNDNPSLVQALEKLRRCRFETRPEFERWLDKRLGNETPYAIRTTILQHAKKVKSIDFDWQLLLAKLGVCLAVCGLVLVVAAWRVDVNLFSLHAVYGNRLVRCYLGASRQDPAAGADRPADSRRWPDPVTGFDPDDDLRLTDLVIGSSTGYDGPFLIVNTALNLVHTERLDWQERKAESFVLTPLACGSLGTGYRRTADQYAGGLSLGRAVALSGAAASPNMGYHSSPAVTALLTVFNARLGGWLGNPASATHWRSPGPGFGFAYLFLELFGWTQEKGRYVYLSDGGHFENLGAYELVRRRCRYVIVSDATQDAEHNFEDLGGLIHKCRVDFGIRIEIDLGSLRRDEQGRCRWHCAVGRIRYDDVDPEAIPGTLIYIKPSLTGDEPADVAHYAERHPCFPHESTANQFYSESQFESYRALGEHIAGAVFSQSVADMEGECQGRAGASHRCLCQALFSSLVRRWFAMPPEYQKTFVESTHGYQDVHEAFRQDERLRRLTLDLYPELDPDQQFAQAAAPEPLEQQTARRCAELHVITQMLRVMETAWLSLNLEVHYAHPLNRGWMGVFHRWTNAETVRKHWPVLRSEFGRDFVSFCEKQMRLGEVEGTPVLIEPGQVPAQRFERLCLEFEDQWPDRTPGLRDRFTRILQQEPGYTGWLIYTDNPYPGAAPVQADQLPVGVILIAPLDDAAGAAQPEVRELFVWLRGAYRNSGLGRSALRKVLGQLRPTPGQEGFRLRIHLPVGDLTGPGGKLQKSMWLTFFHHHDFRQIGTRETEVVLERFFRAPAGP